MENYKLLIFDFDGTIANSYDLIIQGMEKYLGRKIDNKEELRQYPSREVVKKVGMSKLDLPGAIKLIRKEFKEQIPNVKPAHGIVETLTEIKNQHTNLPMVILSSNSEGNITDFLERNALDNIFDRIFSVFTIFGKASELKKVLKEMKCNPEDALYIADETRDIKASKKIGMKNISVTWGYNNEDALKKNNPDILIRKPRELLNL